MRFILFTELEKVFFFLEARSNSKITLIKTKDIVIYHGKNSDGNNGHCEKRIRYGKVA